MACRLFGAKPLSEPMLDSCLLNSRKQILINFRKKIHQYSLRKMHLKNTVCEILAILYRQRCVIMRWFASGWGIVYAVICRWRLFLSAILHRTALRSRHNGHDSVSNHQPRHCLLNRLFRRRSKKKSEVRVTGLCVGNSPMSGEFPAQRASNAENVSIWWRHHGAIKQIECISSNFKLNKEIIKTSAKLNWNKSLSPAVISLGSIDIFSWEKVSTWKWCSTISRKKASASSVWMTSTNLYTSMIYYDEYVPITTNKIHILQIGNNPVIPIKCFYS